MKALNIILTILHVAGLSIPVKGKINELSTNMISRDNNQAYKKVYVDRSTSMTVDDFTFTAYNLEREYETRIKFRNCPYSPRVSYYFYVKNSSGETVDYFTFYKYKQAGGTIYHDLKFTGIDYWNYIGTLTFEFSYSCTILGWDVTYAKFDLDLRVKSFDNSSNKVFIYREARCYPTSGYVEQIGDVWELKNIKHYYEIAEYSYFSFNSYNVKLHLEILSSSYNRSGNAFLSFPYFNISSWPGIYKNDLGLATSLDTDDTLSLFNNRTLYLDKNTHQMYSIYKVGCESTYDYYFPYEDYEKYMSLKIDLYISNFCNYNFLSSYTINIKFLKEPSLNKGFAVVGEIDDTLNDEDMMEVIIP